MTIFATGPRDKRVDKPAGVVVNTTSRAGWSSQLSPFKLGPCKLYDGAPQSESLTMENLWQYSKLYARHADASGNPTAAYWAWAQAGWNSPLAVRYPMGKGVRPLCSLWAGEKLGYVEARKRIYVPVYAALVVETAAFNRLQDMARVGDVVLWDFDGYNHKSLGRDWRYVLNDPSRPCGHAFVLAALLDGELEI